MTTGPDDYTSAGGDPASEGEGGAHGTEGTTPPRYGSSGSEYGGGQQYGGSPYGAPQYGAGGYGAPQYGAGGYQAYPTGGGANQYGTGAGRPADLLPRFGARIIDHLLLGIPFGIIVGILAAVMTNSGFGFWIVNLVVSALFAVVWIGYFVWMETNKGQTVGKMALHLRVQGPGGGLPNVQQSVTRNGYVALEAIGILLGALIPFVGFILQVLCSLGALALIIIIAVTVSNSPTKQGKHDEMAGGTQVVTAR